MKQESFFVIFLVTMLGLASYFGVKTHQHTKQILDCNTWTVVADELSIRREGSRVNCCVPEISVWVEWAVSKEDRITGYEVCPKDLHQRHLLLNIEEYTEMLLSARKDTIQ